MPLLDDPNFRSRSLAARTRELFHERPHYMTFRNIADATGVSVQFITRFIHQKADNPGADKVQALYEHLTKTELRLD